MPFNAKHVISADEWCLCVYQVSDDYVVAVNIFAVVADVVLTAACRKVSSSFICEAFQ